MATKRKEPRKAILTPEEDRIWVFTFTNYLDEGRTEKQADRLTWREMQPLFPRLAEFDGCEASL